MTSSNGNTFRVTGILCGEFSGHRWIHRTKASDAELWCFLLSTPEPTLEQAMETQLIREAIALIMTFLQRIGLNNDALPQFLMIRLGDFDHHLFRLCLDYSAPSHYHDYVIKWNHFPCYWLFLRGIHRSPVNSPHKGQWRAASMFSWICAWINGWVNNHEAGDLRRHCAHYDVTVMM